MGTVKISWTVCADDLSLKDEVVVLAKTAIATTLQKGVFLFTSDWRTEEDNKKDLAGLADAIRYFG